MRQTVLEMEDEVPKMFCVQKKRCTDNYERATSFLKGYVTSLDVW